MEQIYANGVYEIGTVGDPSKTSVLRSAEEAVRMEIRKKVRCDVITLSELQELHGKLVLIAGSKGGNVNRFLEVGFLVVLSFPFSN